MPLAIEHYFDQETSTHTYLLIDTGSQCAAIIDPVLHLDLVQGTVHTQAADLLIERIRSAGLTLLWLLETHIHADHITAAHYIKEQLGGRIAIGSKITSVLAYWIPVFEIEEDTPSDGSQFDRLLDDGDTLRLGDSDITAWHTPGHTPACVSYLIEDRLFVGDALMMPDIGTGRADFPGGDAGTLYDSVKRIYTLPDETQIFLCHDYAVSGRSIQHHARLEEHKKHNILLSEHTSKDEFIATRHARDAQKKNPQLLFPALQMNMRAGALGKPSTQGHFYIKIPISVG